MIMKIRTLPSPAVTNNQSICNSLTEDAMLDFSGEPGRLAIKLS